MKFSVSNTQGKADNVYFPRVVEVNNLEELLEKVAFYDHIAGEFKDNRRKNENFISTDCIIMDCDNDDCEVPLLPEAFKNIKCIIVFSRNNDKPKGDKPPRKRYHIYFRLSKKIRSAAQVRDLKERIIACFPQLDEGAKDAARQIFGHKTPTGLAFDGVYIDELLRDEKGETVQQTIPEGTRDDTLYRQAIHFLVENDEAKAYELFMETSEKCSPALPDWQVQQKWSQALKSELYGAKLWLSSKMKDGAELDELREEFFETEFPPLNKEQKRKLFKTVTKGYRKKRKKKQDERAEQIALLCDSFLAAYPVCYTGTRSHGQVYRFDEGYWKEITDQQLHGLLNQFVKSFTGKSALPSFIHELYMKLIDETVIEPNWNKKTLYNFKNGTLDLDTGEFYKHKPEDYSTLPTQDFDYDESAESPLIGQFLSSLACNKDDRLATLTDLLGYTLFRDCSLKKGFFLIGRTDNGKSTFINFLDLMHNSAIACVRPDELTKSFKRFELRDAALNLIDDIKGDFSQASDPFKSAISGGVMSGGRKFKDEERFFPRAKWVLCCNEMPTSECSEAMDNRMVFIRFEADFSHGKGDPQILKKLEKEKAGIFNFIYKAYKDLKQRMEIRMCSDQAALAKEYEELSDSVIEFWEYYKSGPMWEYRSDFADEETLPEKLPPDKPRPLAYLKEPFNHIRYHKVSDVADDYVDFCKKRGMKPEPTNKFRKRFAEVSGARKVQRGSYRLYYFDLVDTLKKMYEQQVVTEFEKATQCFPWLFEEVEFNGSVWKPTDLDRLKGLTQLELAETWLKECPYDENVKELCEILAKETK